MSKFDNSCFRAFSLVEEDIDKGEFDDLDSLLDMDKDRERDAFRKSLDDPENIGKFNDLDNELRDNQNTQRELKKKQNDNELNQLKKWIKDISNFKDLLNGGSDSILSNLKQDNTVGTIFDDLSDSTKNGILDIAERLASLNEELRHLMISHTREDS